MLKVKEHNVETGEIIERDPTEDELAQYAKDEAERIAQKEAVERAKAIKTTLLEKLGITEEEAKLLLS